MATATVSSRQLSPWYLWYRAMKEQPLLCGSFLALMIFAWAHFGEHVVQGVQIWVLHWARPAALGFVGMIWPWLIASEHLHFWIAVIMWVGMEAHLRMSFKKGTEAYKQWLLATRIQRVHLVTEHVLLFAQVQFGWFPFGPTPMGLFQYVLQLFVPRAEIHFVFNTVVLVPMTIGGFFQTRDNLAQMAAKLSDA